MWLRGKQLAELSAVDWLQLKKRGFSDSQIARAIGSDMMTGEGAWVGGWGVGWVGGWVGGRFL